MALVLKEIYSSVVEDSMRIVDDTLSEKDRRHYVAVEALKLGSGTGLDGITIPTRLPFYG